ncbi:MAG: hypothetical protein JNL97_04915, partial [Verrucomicrobiales bacterium]|nr:hypothetical protein [Verrucomicrobiales bacterium]
MNLLGSRRPPLRFAILALALIVPALGLVAVAVWAIRADRRAAEADLRERADALAGELLVAIQDTLEMPRPRPAVLSALGSGWGQMGLDAEGGLSWPIVGPWPPVPRTLPPAATSEGRAAWQAAVEARARGDWETAAIQFGNFVDGEGGGHPDPGVRTSAAQDRRSLVAIARLE